MRHALPFPMLALAVACAPAPTDDPVDTDVDTVSTEHALTVGAGFGAQPFSCRAPAPDVGESGLTVRPADLRLHLHDLAWVLPSGEPAPWTLDEAAPWQREGAVLIDLETGADACADGTPGTNDQVTGRADVPEGLDTATLRFTLGLPFASSHAPLTAAPPPLDDGDLFLSTTQGRAHFQLDLAPQGGQPTWPVRIHATGCTPAGDGSPQPCISENLVTFEVEGVSVDAPELRLELSTLLATTDLQQNAIVTLPGGGTVESPAGCQSTSTDLDCGPIFQAYGLGTTEPTWIVAAP